MEIENSGNSNEDTLALRVARSGTKLAAPADRL